MNRVRLAETARPTTEHRRLVGLTAQRLTRAARAHAPKPTRRSACTHVSRAMQAARRREILILTSRLGRRTEAGPRRVLPRVRRRIMTATPSPLTLHSAQDERSRPTMERLRAAACGFGQCL